MKITSEQAERMLFDMLAKEQIEDRVYEFAQDLFNRYIDEIEKNEITDMEDFLTDDVEWYDDVRDEFFFSVYAKVKKFLNQTKR